MTACALYSPANVESERKLSREEADRAIGVAVQHHRAGRLDEAEKLYRKVLVAYPSHPDALQLLGVCFGMKGDAQKAVDLIARALVIRPDAPEILANYGQFLRALGRVPESVTAFARALDLNGNDPGIHNGYGVSLAELNDHEGAIREFRRAIQLNANLADAHNNLAAALNAAGRLDEAMTEIRIAMSMNPRLPGIHSNMGNILVAMGKYDEAIATISEALKLHPNDPKLHANLALPYLVTGDFVHGWREYEWRVRVTEIVGRRQFSKPRWDGAKLDGKKILIHTEQGFGDAIQFARFLPRVAELAGSVILELSPKLTRLFTGFPGVAQIVERNTPLPEYDLHCPLMSLAGIFAVTEKTIPRDVPYLRADPETAAKWKTRFGSDDGRLRVGLAWAGLPDHRNDRNRSMKLEILGPLASANDAAFYSLQLGPLAAQAANPPPSMQITDWTADLTDFAETAGLMDNLDLIVTVDTAVAHLAGAMGKRVYVLIPKVPDWRWMLERTDSPWYPTMRLFRQTVAGNWTDAVQQAAAALALEKR